MNEPTKDLSPYLSAIQSVDGQTPGQKYKILNDIAAKIIENNSLKELFLSTGITDLLPASLTPHLRILLGNKLRHVSLVVEALKSDDVSVIKQALSAKWFFDPCQAHVSADYFLRDVFPHVAMRTRLELLKTLAHHLDQEKADDFFSKFTNSYGFEQALPLLSACSEKYIFESVLERKIVLPSRVLGILYRRYPKLVIRYLQLGNEKNETNKEERAKHKIKIEDYKHFLPILVKHHTLEFIELFECLPEYMQYLQLGNTRAESFLKNATDILMAKPKIYMIILPLKLVSNKLSTGQFETMFEQLFPKDKLDFNINAMIKYLKYYPQEKKLSLLMEKFQLLYGEELLKPEIIKGSSEFFKLLPADMREDYGRKEFEYYAQKGENEPIEHAYVLPPRESFGMLKERINRTSSALPRSTLIKDMIVSCAFYESKEDLLEVLRYYNQRHNNEQSPILYTMLYELADRFDLKSLDKAHWGVLKDIIQRAYIKGDLYQAPCTVYTTVMKSALHFYLKQCRQDKVEEESKILLDKMVSIILVGVFERDIKWSFLSDCSEIERDCLQLFLTAIPNKYPSSHVVWTRNEIKCWIVKYLVSSMHKFNEKNFFIESRRKYSAGTTIKDSEGNEVKSRKFSLKDYPWLSDMALNLMRIEDSEKWKNRYMYTELRLTLREHDDEYYQKLIDEDEKLINDVHTKDGLSILKRDPKKVLAKCDLYLKSCRKLLKSKGLARSFVRSTKWHQEIPVKFVERCLAEIESEGSMLVLGILLDGESLGKIMTPYLPKSKKLDLDEDDAKKLYRITALLPRAMNLANPPVSFDVVASLCQGDFVPLATHTLSNIAQRAPIDRVLTFARQLVNKPVAVKRLGLRLAIRVAAKTEALQFLGQVWKEEQNHRISEIAAKMIHDVFLKIPDDDTWHLVKTCIEELEPEDIEIFVHYEKIENVDEKYVVPYVSELVKKLEECKLPFLGLVNNIDAKVGHILPDDLMTKIVQSDFFNYPVNFLLDIYVFVDEKKVDKRLEVVLKIVECANFDEKSDTKSPTKNRSITRKAFCKKILEIFEHQITFTKAMSLKLVDAFLNTFEKKSHMLRFPNIYILLKIYRNYYNTNTLQEFGVGCAETIVQLVRELGSEMYLNDISKVINRLLQIVEVNKVEQASSKMIIIEGLITGDKRLGALVGSKLLQSYLNSDKLIDFSQLKNLLEGMEDASVIVGWNTYLNTFL